MKVGKKRKIIAIGAVSILIIISISASGMNISSSEKNISASAINTKTSENSDENISFIIRLTAAQKNSNNNFLIQKDKVTSIEVKIQLNSDDALELIEKLEEINEKIKNSKSDQEQIDLYSRCFELLQEHDILPDGFSIDMLIETAKEISRIISKDINNNKRFSLNRLNNNQVNNFRDDGSIGSLSKIHQGETRIDIATGFFVLTFFSAFSPWNVFIPILVADGDVYEIPFTDLPIGRFLADIFENLENDVFLLGWTLALGYTEIISVPGNGIIGGQAALSLPSGTPIYTFLDVGSSLIVPMAYGTGSLTILYDRGPKQLPVPLIDIGLFGSVAAIHMPYSRDPN